jgi:hypothetical protein
LSHGKSKDIETVFETCLIKYSPIRGKDLRVKLGERGIKLSRSQFYRYAAKFVEYGKLKRINGIYYYQEPREQIAVEKRAGDGASGEIGLDEARMKAKAMMERFAAIAGYTYSNEELAYVFNETDGKRMIDKAEELVSLRRNEALFLKRTK